MTSRDFLSVGSQQVNSDRFTEKEFIITIVIFCFAFNCMKEAGPQIIDPFVAAEIGDVRYCFLPVAQ